MDDQGSLFILVHTSWRPTADLLGHRAADVLSDTFESFCRRAAALTTTSARLDLTTFGTFFDETAAAPQFADWFPATIAMPGLSLRMTVKDVQLDRAPGEEAFELYRRAQLAVGATWDAVPVMDRYLGLTLSWEEVVGQMP